MTTDHRLAALEGLRELRERLRDSEESPLEAAVSECDSLIQAVEAFHLEGIRFRLYGLHRRLTRDDAAAVPSGAVKILEDARAALVAAGFKV